MNNQQLPFWNEQKPNYGNGSMASGARGKQRPINTGNTEKEETDDD